MPYKKRQPVSEAEMEKKDFLGHHSICQTLRDMYHETEDPNIRLKCRLCVAFAKAMNDKLQYYKHLEEERMGILPPGTIKPRKIEDGDA